MSFRELKDQPNVIPAIKAALEKGRLGHALLFQGGSDSASRETAMELAKALFCEDLKEWESCDACRPCRLVVRNAHPDYLKVSPLEGSEVVKIGQIRELVATANLKPFEARSKLFVIDPAEAMNEEAQSAFLKTLEEPPGSTRFVLITRNPAGLLETIRSRCRLFSFAPSREAASKDPELEGLKREATEIFLSRGERRTPGLPDLAKFEREEVQELLDTLMEYFRDCLLIRVGADAMLSGEEDLSRKRRVAGERSETELQDLIQFFSEIKEKVSEKVNLKLVASALWEAAP